MPRKPPKPCNKYGCRFTAVKEGYCNDHWQPRWKRYQSGPKIHDTVAWQKLRRAKLRRCPVCECDDSKCQRLATTVHHIKPVEDGGEPFDWDNLRSMTRGCHEREHGRKS